MLEGLIRPNIIYSTKDRHFVNGMNLDLTFRSVG